MKVPAMLNPDRMAQRSRHNEQTQLPHEFEVWFFRLLIESRSCNRFELSATTTSWVNTLITDLQQNRLRLTKMNEALAVFGYELQLQTLNQQPTLVLLEISSSLAYFYQNVMRNDLRKHISSSDFVTIRNQDFWWAEPLISSFIRNTNMPKRCAEYFPGWTFSLSHRRDGTVLEMRRRSSR